MKREFLTWRVPTNVKVALENETLLDWSLGILPWSFRKPIMCQLDVYFSEHPQLESLHRTIRDAINFLRFRIRSPATFEHATKLVEFYCELSGTPKEDALAELKRIPENRLDAPEVLDSLFRSKLLLAICKDVQKHLPDCISKAETVSALRALDTAFFDERLSIPVHKARLLEFGSQSETLRTFFFCRWQYIQRNKGYKKLQDKASKILRDDDLRRALPFLDLKEIIMIPPLSVKQKRYSQHNAILATKTKEIQQLNDLTKQSRKRYKMLISWPLEDYGSETIMRRILSDEFKCWERPVPPSFLLDLPPEVKPQNKACFDKLWKEIIATQEVFFASGEQDNAEHLENTVRYYSTVYEIEKLYSNEVTQRINAAPTRRVIGIWLWDYMKKHTCSVAESIKALYDIFPELKAHTDHALISDVRTAEASIQSGEYKNVTSKKPKNAAGHRKRLRANPPVLVVTHSLTPIS